MASTSAVAYLARPIASWIHCGEMGLSPLEREKVKRPVKHLARPSQHIADRRGRLYACRLLVITVIDDKPWSAENDNGNGNWC